MTEPKGLGSRLQDDRHTQTRVMAAGLSLGYVGGGSSDKGGMRQWARGFIAGANDEPRTANPYLERGWGYAAHANWRGGWRVGTDKADRAIMLKDLEGRS